MLSDELGSRRRLEGRLAIRSAFDTLIEAARQSLQLFDADGELYGFDRPSTAAAMRRLLLRTPDNQVTLVVQDIGPLSRQAPLLSELLGTFAPRLQVLRGDDSLRGVERGFVIVDQAAVLRRPAFNQQLAFLDYDPAAVADARTLFEQVMAQSGPGLTGRTTGL